MTGLEKDFFDALADARRDYSTGGIEGAAPSLKRMFDAYDAINRWNGLTPVERILHFGPPVSIRHQLIGKSVTDFER